MELKDTPEYKEALRIVNKFNMSNLNKIVIKYNSGLLAILCSECRVILKIGKEFTIDELKALQGKIELEAQYCDKCKIKNYDKNNFILSSTNK